MKPTVLLDYEFVVSANAYTVRALLKLEGKAPDSGQRQPLNLSLVLDRSGSMGGEKLHAARRAAAHLVRHLAPDDTVSVVAFDDEVHTVAEPATGAEQAHLARTIESIEAGGSTNLSGGWLQGREFVARKRRRTGTNRILLLTDGQANVGIVDPAALRGLCEVALEHGITTTTIGFGDGYDEELLQAMADAGGGNMHYIESPDQAPAVFAEEIEGLLSLAAQNITVDVRPGSAVQVTAVHHSYPSSELPDGVRLQVGDLYAREPKMVLVELLVPDAAAADGAAIAECVVVAQVLTAEGGVERQELRLPIVHPLSREGHEEPEIRREMLLLGAAKARESALREQAEGNYGAARRYLREAYADLEVSGIPADSLMQEEIDDLRVMEARLDPGVFNAADAKYLNQRAYNSLRSAKSGTQRISRARTPTSGIDHCVGDAARPAGSGPRIIAHVINDQGAWGKGFVLALSHRWPLVRDRYLEWHAGTLPDAPAFELGEILLTRVEADTWVASLLVQTGLRPVGGRPPVRYRAIEKALPRLAVEAARLGATVHMPRLGTGLAGGDWARVEPLVERYLVRVGVPVVVYDRPSPSLPTV